MQLKTDANSFIRFLKNEKFIEWKLFSTDELNTYWEEYLRQYPGEKDDILLAEKYFRSINVLSLEMPQEKKKEAILRLEQSLSTYSRKRRIRRLAYVAAACVAALVISVLYLQKEMNRSRDELLASSGYIVGSELKAEDILFITGNRTATFQGNVDIQIQGDKTARVRSEDAEDAEISIEQHAMNKLIVPYGKRSKIILPDGTQAWLNSGSMLEFPSSFTGGTRTVKLSGEMYIEVAPDRNSAFIVQASDFKVAVFGTKFNVTSYDGSRSSVVLVEGSVGLSSTGREELILSPNEQAVLSDVGTFDRKKVDVQLYTSWKDGYLTFNDTPILDALKQIERYYNLSFNFGNNVSFDGLTCTGKIILSENLDNVMTTLSLISSTGYRKEGKTIYIYKK